ncbi:MAG: CpXC domain-containing protein [Peptostreptococcaceae bacterium]|nr:CpXC domain-containing protein [Peptostreptococcaceae bacterium]
MSITRNVNGKCPKCNSDINIKIWDSVNAVYHPEEKEKIMKSELFKVKCDNCGSEIALEYPCRYQDTDNHIMIYLIPDFSEDQVKELNDDLENVNMPQMMEDNKFRVVSNCDELIEKILIFESEKRDRPIELCKRKVFKDIKADNAEISPVSILYNHNTEGEYFSFIGCKDDKGEALIVPFDKELYKSLDIELVNRDAYKEGMYEVIDGRWAATLMK